MAWYSGKGLSSQLSERLRSEGSRVHIALAITFLRLSLNGKNPGHVTAMEGSINRSISNQVGLDKKEESVSKTTRA
jgi:hypothetical protein